VSRASPLEAEYGSDRDLLEFYRRRLLRRGWAGKLTDGEHAYILAHAGWMQRAVQVGSEAARRNRRIGAKSPGSAGLQSRHGTGSREAERRRA
jgi:hypothetical protein